MAQGSQAQRIKSVSYGRNQHGEWEWRWHRNDGSISVFPATEELARKDAERVAALHSVPVSRLDHNNAPLPALPTFEEIIASEPALLDLFEEKGE